MSSRVSSSPACRPAPSGRWRPDGSPTWTLCCCRRMRRCVRRWPASSGIRPGSPSSSTSIASCSARSPTVTCGARYSPSVDLDVKAGRLLEEQHRQGTGFAPLTARHGAGAVELLDVMGASRAFARVPLPRPGAQRRRPRPARRSRPGRGAGTSRGRDGRWIRPAPRRVDGRDAEADAAGRRPAAARADRRSVAQRRYPPCQRDDALPGRGDLEPLRRRRALRCRDQLRRRDRAARHRGRARACSKTRTSRCS